MAISNMSMSVCPSFCLFNSSNSQTTEARVAKFHQHNAAASWSLDTICHFDLSISKSAVYQKIHTYFTSTGSPLTAVRWEHLYGEIIHLKYERIVCIFLIFTASCEICWSGYKNAYLSSSSGALSYCSIAHPLPFTNLTFILKRDLLFWN